MSKQRTLPEHVLRETEAFERGRHDRQLAVMGKLARMEASLIRQCEDMSTQAAWCEQHPGHDGMKRAINVGQRALLAEIETVQRVIDLLKQDAP